MTKRALRVIKWLGQTPVVGACGFCGQQFTVPMMALSRTQDAQASMKGQFDRHICKPAIRATTEELEQ
jgi:hypothetical protein